MYDNVSHGFHRSLSLLKDPDMTSVESSEAFQETLRDFNNIMQIVIRGNKILPIQVHESIEILYSVRRNLNDCTRLQQSISSMQDHLDCDIFNVSWKQSLQTLIIHHCKSLMISGQLYCILYKGHGKDKESDRSYRTISTCPLLAKCLDIYVGKRYFSS